MVIDTTHSTLTSPLFQFSLTQTPKTYRPYDPWLLIIPNIVTFITFRFLKPIAADKFSPITLLYTINFLLMICFVEMFEGTDRWDCSEGVLILTSCTTFVCVMQIMKRFEDVARRYIVGARGYCQFYAVSFLYLWMFEQYCYEGWFQILNSLIMLPQILHNFYHGFRPKLNPPYYIIIMSNQLYMLYYRGVPHNLLLM